jgi:predicted Fe-Mo cluster-binding NifX family protein
MKKLAIASTGKEPGSLISPYFGRCPFFMIVEVEGKELKGFNAVENRGANQFGGAGMAAAQQVGEQGAVAAIAGAVGPRAFYVLQQLGIKTYTGMQGKSVEENVQKYVNGELDGISAPTGVTGMPKGSGRRRGGAGGGAAAGRGRGRRGPPA